MSGGHFSYKDKYLKDEIFGFFPDTPALPEVIGTIHDNPELLGGEQ